LIHDDDHLDAPPPLDCPDQASIELQAAATFLSLKIVLCSDDSHHQANQHKVDVEEEDA
jgi:hypothetical protein